jgi:hypothetical protein
VGGMHGSAQGTRTGLLQRAKSARRPSCIRKQPRIHGLADQGNPVPSRHVSDVLLMAHFASVDDSQSKQPLQRGVAMKLAYGDRKSFADELDHTR